MYGKLIEIVITNEGGIEIMKICGQCGAEVSDNASFCAKCGAKLETPGNPETAGGAGSTANAGNAGGAVNQGQYQQYYQAPVDPYDHTAEFDRKDISDNKVFAMIAYLTGTVGIIIALLASSKSAYAMFHVRQSLKFTVLNTLAGIVALILIWTFIVPVVAGLFIVVLFVCRIIAFFSICAGKAKEPYIVRSFNFLR